MNNTYFFAETAGGQIVQFYTMTFLLGGTLYAWTDHKTIEKIVIDNINKIDKKSNLYVRTKENWYSYRPNGYSATGNSTPTEYDIPLHTLKSVWIEKW